MNVDTKLSSHLSPELLAVRDSLDGLLRSVVSGFQGVGLSRRFGKNVLVVVVSQKRNGQCIPNSYKGFEVAIQEVGDARLAYSDQTSPPLKK